MDAIVSHDLPLSMNCLAASASVLKPMQRVWSFIPSSFGYENCPKLIPVGASSKIEHIDTTTWVVNLLDFKKFAFSPPCRSFINRNSFKVLYKNPT